MPFTRYLEKTLLCSMSGGRPCQIPVLGLGYIKLICWSKKFHVNTQTSQMAAKTIGCSPQANSKAPLQKTIPTQLNEHVKVELLLTENLCPYVLAALVQAGTLNASKRETETSSWSKTPWFKMVSCLKAMLQQWWHKSCGSHHSGLTEDSLHKMEPDIT